MTPAARKIAALAEAARYGEAYQVGRNALRERPDDEPVLLALKAMAATLRRICRDLAHDKATEHSPELREREALLRRLNGLTGEGMHG